MLRGWSLAEHVWCDFMAYLLFRIFSLFYIDMKFVLVDH